MHDAAEERPAVGSRSSSSEVCPLLVSAMVLLEVGSVMRLVVIVRSIAMGRLRCTLLLLPGAGSRRTVVFGYSNN